MTYTRGDHRRAIRELAIANGWTEAPPLWSDTELWERRESQIALVWTERDTLQHASINIQGSAGRIPAPPRMALVQAREWLSAPGESQ